jgi:hypothetical protein
MYRISIFMFSIVLFACSSQNDKLQKISTPDKEAESVYLTQDQHCNPVIAWTEKGENKTKFYYSISLDGGKTFNERITVPVTGEISTHAEGMPKVAFKKSGEVIAAFEKKTPTKENKYAGAIYYVQSTDEGKTWSAAQYIHSDTIAGRSRSFFDIQTLPDGEIGAAWLDIKLNADKGGRSVRFAKTENVNGFTNEILIDSSACECCRIDVYTDTEKTNIAYRGLMKGNVGQSIRDMMFTASVDGGKTFSRPVRISSDDWVIDGCPHTGPSLCSSKVGLHALWYTEGKGRGIYYAYAEKDGNRFTSREQIAPQGHHPQLCTYSNSVAMVWEETVGNTNKSWSRIRFQLRNDMSLKGNFLTPEGANAYLPVIIEGKDRCLVAFLMEDASGTGVYLTGL